MDWTLPEAARAADLEAVLALLEEAGLPTVGVADAFPAGYSVIRSGSQLIATAGLEVHGRVGLLRSVAVLQAQRRSGLGRALIDDRLHAARERGLVAVYLLTTTAPEFFRRLGFEDTTRAAVPSALLGSSEFATVCPASAICLVKSTAAGPPAGAERRPRCPGST